MKLSKSKKKIELLQDRLKKNAKHQNQFQNGLMQIKRIQLKKDKGRILFKMNQIKS